MGRSGRDFLRSPASVNMQARLGLGPPVRTLLLLVMSGCASPQGTGWERSLAASPRPYVPDIPLPQGFRLADQSSEDWATGPIRYVRHRYTGRADKYVVRRFYLEQMPLVKWAAVSNGSVYGYHTLQFRRQDESCTVTIADAPGGLFGQVRVEVVIAPIVE